MKYKYYPAAAFSSSISILILLTLKEYVLKNTINEIATKIIIDLLIGLGVFTLLYFFCFLIYTTYLNRKMLLHKFKGQWFQILAITKKDGTLDIRHGKCDIRIEDGQLTFNATTYHIDNLYSSFWKSSAIIMDGKNITLIFTSKGNRELTDGTMDLLLESDNKIVGRFSDNAPGKNYGNVSIYKNEDDYKEKLKDIINYSIEKSIEDSTNI